jgi:hypothetical protein
MKKKILIILMSLALLCLVGCKGDTSIPRYYTVTFDTGETATNIPSIRVREGYHIEGVVTPSNFNIDAIFRGWYSDSEYVNKWDVNNYRVSSDMTLYAKWSYLFTYPTEISLTDDAFSKTLTWMQKDISADDTFSVSIIKGSNLIWDEILEQYQISDTFSYTGTEVLVNGTVTVNGNVINYKVEDTIEGGYYKVIVRTNKAGIADGCATEICFKGSGTEEDPYLVYNEADLMNISTNNISENTYIELRSDVTLHSLYTDKKGCVFNGIFASEKDAKYTITLKNNSGLFYEIGESGIVHDIKFKGALSGSDPSIGVVCNYNRGTIYNIESSAVSVNSQGGKVNDITTLEKGGVGGIVGTNLKTGNIYACNITSAQDNVIQGNIGVGCVAGINYGYIHDLTSSGIVGAYNGNEISATVRNSYAGGAVGVNYGTVYRVNVDGKINCRRIDEGEYGAGACNIGGVVGYNATSAIINECIFQGMRCVGDTNVGGISGYNDGTITNSYTGRRVRKPSNTVLEERQFISPVIGSYNVGGICGKVGDNSIIFNVFSTANVWSYRMKGYSIAEKATNAIGVMHNQNLRTAQTYLGQKYGVVYSNDLESAKGDNNIMIDNSDRVGLVINHLLGWDVKDVYNEYTKIMVKENVINNEKIEQYLSILGSSFKSDSTWGIVLSWNRE